MTTRRLTRQAVPRTGAIALLLCLLAGPALAAPGSLAKARNLLKQEQPAEALEMLKGLLAGKPDDGELLYWYGRAAIEAQEYSVAEEALTTVTEAMARSADAHYWLGIAYERGGNLGEALEAYRQALAIDGGHKLSAEGAERVTPEAAPDDPGHHHAVALEVEGGLSVDRGQAKVESPRMHDYTFARAPTDWYMELGDWRVRSRWSCTPDWNFMGGESPQVAALWNKREFLGDVTVEAYMSFKMNVMGEGGYRNGTDLNLSICADGRNLFSGYSFIVGGWGNSWTRILKGTEVLAETNAATHRPVTLLDGAGGGTWQWHRRWWEVRAIKRGQFLYLFLDNELILQAHDPDPIPGGRVAMWTYDNGVMIPRVRIYHEDERPAADRSDPPYAPVISAENRPPPAPAVTFTSETHPSYGATFDHDLGGWTRRDGQHGALLLLDPLTPSGAGQCLRLINEYSGGTFGATAVAGPFDAVTHSRLSFDYRVPETLKVNLQLTAEGTRYEVVFTAPELPSDRALHLATIPDVATDVKWHHAELDLLGCLRRFYPDAESIAVSDVWFGLDTARDYALAGAHGNPAVCEYRIDNFRLTGAGPADGQVQVALAPPAEGETAPEVTFDIAVTDSPTPQLDGRTDSADGVVPLAGLGEGTHYVHAQALTAEGPLGPAYSRAVTVDATAPRVASITPEPGGATSGEEFVIALEDAGAGVAAASLALKLNDADIAADSPALGYDPVHSTVTLRPAAAGLTLEAGADITLSLVSCADRLGNALSAPQTWVFKHDAALDETPPTVASIGLPRAPLCEDTFEDGLGQWHAYAASIPAALSIDPTTAAAGSHSLRVYNPKSSGAMGAVARNDPFDAGVYRYVSFDYKLRPEARIDLYAVVNGTGYSVALSNNDGANSLGAFDDVVLDDQWHHAECDLYSLLKATAPTAPGYMVTSLMFLDAGSYGNIQHQYYNIDNFCLSPVVSAQDGEQVAVVVADANGISGLSALIDAFRLTQPPTEATERGSQVALADVPAGDAWLHIRAADEAGNWSDTTHRYLAIDGQKPSAAAGAPASGAATAVSQVSASITDAGIAGVDPLSLQLEVGGTTYTVADSGLTYNSADGSLLWNCEQTSGGPVVFTNGQQVPVRLLAAADYAANPAPELPAWSWTMDYSQDTTAPALASLSSGTHSTYTAFRYEGSVHQTQAYGSDSTAQIAVDPATTPDGGGASVKVTNASDGGNMAFYVHSSTYSSASYPYLTFDYRVPAGVTLDMGVYFYNETLWFRFTGDAGGYTTTLPSIVADGQWHRCTFNLYEQLAARAAARGIGAYYTVSYITFYHRDAAALPAGAQVNLDNFVVSAAGAAATTLNWSATDTTGIAGYSYLVDQSPITEPPTTPQDAAVQAQYADRPAGLSWFHIRAVDGAGNWGPTSHLAMLVQ